MKNLGFKVMMGVIPGYGHENKELTAGNAYKVGKETWEESVKEVMNRQSDPENPESPMFYAVEGQIIPALAVYAKEFGCPAGGEVGMQVEATMEDGQDADLYRKSVIETIKVAMSKLSQSTTTIEWAEDGISKGTTYIYDKGEKMNENDSLDGIEHFSVSLGNGEKTDEEYVRVGSAIQDASKLVSSRGTGKPNEKYYIVSGLMTPEPGENGGIQLAGSQNPIYGQTDNKLYRDSWVEVVKEVMKSLGQEKATIKFNEEVVDLNLSEILKEQTKPVEIAE